MANKVRYGLKNAHYAEVTFAADGTPTFGTPVAIPGAVSIALSKQGDTYTFYADDGSYFELGDNASYEGDTVFALIPEALRAYALGETLDAKNVLVEGANPAKGHFALLFEFTGDQKAIRHVLYNCTASENTLEGQTKGENIEVQTETLTITARALPNGGPVKARTTETTDATVYNDWYTTVHQLAVSAGG
ncbi:MAG: phage tail protein [Clostridia bacterium]|nr:phage tail protein [Clostridia bacterium]